MSEQNPPIEEKTSPATNVSQWVTFTLEGEQYAVGVTSVQEILRYTEIVPVPGAPQFVQGIINRRGQIITIINPRVIFGLPDADVNDQSRIIILETDELLLGVLVDAVGEVRLIPKTDIESTPNVGTEESAKYIIGVYKTEEGALLILLDLRRVGQDD